MRLDGIDVAHYQYDYAPIAWQQVRNAGCWWGATKATQGTGYADPTMTRSRQSMFAVGFTHIGLYHWLSAKLDPKAQAAWFLAEIGTLAHGEFAMLDAEEAGITVAQVVAWCEAVEAVTRRPVAVYSGAYVAGGTIWRAAPVRWSTYGPRPMILAAYTTEVRAQQVCDFAHYPWDGWQFSSNGPVPGVTGRCDMDRIDNVPAFDKAAGITREPLVEVEPPVPPVVAIPNPEEEPVRYIADSKTLGSALVECVIGADGVPHHTMRGFDVDGARERAVWIAGGLAAVPYSDADYQALAASKVASKA